MNPRPDTTPTWGEQYEDAIKRLQPHIHREANGKFRMDDGADSLGLDPVVLADLRRSMEHTNELIARGEIDPASVKIDG